MHMLPLKFTTIFIFFSLSGSAVQQGLWPPCTRGFLITQWHATVGRTPLDKWSAHHRDRYPTTHTTNIHSPGGIPTQDRSRQAAGGLCLRPHGHWDWHTFLCINLILANKHYSALYPFEVYKSTMFTAYWLKENATNDSCTVLIHIITEKAASICIMYAMSHQALTITKLCKWLTLQVNNWACKHNCMHVCAHIHPYHLICREN
jgi:hypothetical protein